MWTFTISTAIALLSLAKNVSAQSNSSVTILFQNDLSSNVSTPALLVNASSTYANAEAACAVYNEQLLSAVSDDIVAQLRYLSFANVTTNSTGFWYSGSQRQQRRSALFGRQTSICDTYTLDGEEEADCNEQHPVLCTSSPSAFSVTNASPAAGSEVTVQSGNLTVQGYRDARSFRFLGLPFAAPPVGDLRFRPATPYNGTTTLNGTAFGSACIQMGGPYGASSDTDEDCLTLNIWTPYIPAANSTRGLKAVSFWLYGGAFVNGAGSLPDYDGGNAVSRGDIVVVTMNYRLGSLGNLATSDGTFSGSQGITDQIQALKWVQEYISGFGGDPSRVTIYGQSAGGQSVVALLSSSAAKGLFSAAIQQSGPLGIPWPVRRVYSQYIAPAVGTALNCSTPTNETALIDCLLQAPATSFASIEVSDAVDASASEALMLYNGATAVTSRIEPFAPIVNAIEGVIDGQFLDLVRNGNLPSAGIPVMMGNMEDEATLFIASAVPAGLPSTQDVLSLVLSQALPNQTAQVVIENPSLFQVNTTDPNGVANAAASLATLYAWECPLNDILTTTQQQSTFSSLYAYRMDQGTVQSQFAPAACTPNNPSGFDQTCHTEDISEMFGNSNVRGREYNATNPLPYTQLILDHWTAFIRTHNPQPSQAYLQARGRGYEETLTTTQAVPFPQFGGNTTQTLHRFTSEPSNIELAYPFQCALLEPSLLVNTINSTFVQA